MNSAFHRYLTPPAGSQLNLVFKILLYVLLTCIPFFTVFLNLLVIISISHFRHKLKSYISNIRQLQTPTNLLLLSLAVADFLVGLLLMSAATLQIEGCWVLGITVCVLFNYMAYILTTASVGNMVLISVDRYIAICDPLFYPTKVTPRRFQTVVCLCWSCSVFYSGLILGMYLKDPEAHNSCYGECGLIIDYKTSTVDIVLTVLGPIAVIIVLYMRVFVVAVSQARAMRSHIAAVTLKGRVPVRAKKSERKAATALGVVVIVFLICYCPYFYPTITGQALSMSNTYIVFAAWLLYCNSCLNPIIYASFYPWFRKSVKRILTLQILQPSSRDANILIVER